VPDVFISYTKADAKYAELVRKQLAAEELSVFLAPAAIPPGARWSPHIRTALKESDWVILLVSKAACRSVFVNQEFGQALAMNKGIVPVVWDMDPAELPGWMAEHQALDLRGDILFKKLAVNISHIATSVRAKKTVGLLLGVALVGGLIYLAAKEGG
jgi:hypothetical protein